MEQKKGSATFVVRRDILIKIVGTPRYGRGGRGRGRGNNGCRVFRRLTAYQAVF